MTATEKLLQWYDKNKRSLPWRETKDPYAIWVSEIMLQQTRVDTAIDYYRRFLKAFKDVHALARASEFEVLNVWKGLGYYSRARNMMRAAKAVAADYNGEFPREFAILRKLPGIGAYTAGAVLSIAYGIPVPAVDGNVLRVIARYLALHGDIALPATKKAIENAVSAMIATDRAGDFTQALMELGATVCTPFMPKCVSCPLKENCAAYEKDLTGALPVKIKKSNLHPVQEYNVFAIRNKSSLLMQYRGNETLLANMWGLPMAPAGKDSVEEILKLGLADFCEKGLLKIGTVKHVFTHRTWQMAVFEYETAAKFPAEEPLRWVEFHDLQKLPVPTAFKKVLKLIKIC